MFHYRILPIPFVGPPIYHVYVMPDHIMCSRDDSKVNFIVELNDVF